MRSHLGYAHTWDKPWASSHLGSVISQFTPGICHEPVHTWDVMSQLTSGICHEPVRTWDLPVHTWDLSWASSYLGSVTSLVIIFLLCSLCECRTVDAINKLSSSSSAACVNSEWWMPQLSYHVPHLQFVWKRSDGCCQCQSGWRWWTYVAWLLPPPPRPWCVCNHSNRDTDTSHTDTSHIDTSHTDTSHIDTMTHHTLTHHTLTHHT